MPDTPNMLRGEFYSTHRIARCPSYKQCNICRMCENYDKHHVQCQLCEDRKVPRSICTCTPKNRMNYLLFTEKMGGPLIDPNNPNKKKNNVQSAAIAEDKKWAEIADGLKETYGKLSPTPKGTIGKIQQD